MNRVINSLGHVKNVIDGLNGTVKHYLKGRMELLGILTSNDTLKIGMLSSTSKDISVNFCYDVYTFLILRISLLD